MRIIKLLSIITLFFLITFGIIGCGSSDGDGNGEIVIELICDDGLDNDENGFTDCEDLACIIDPVCEVECEEFVNASCNRLDECGILFIIPCEDSLLLLIEEEEIFDCNQIVELPTANECISDLANFDCEALINDLGPDSCSASEGLCDVCDVDEDCSEGLLCFDCTGDCTGVAKRCTNAFFDQVCEDGTFGS